MKLQLPRDIEASLRQQAAALGMNVEQFAIETIRDRLADAPGNVESGEPLSKAQWKAEFRSWTATFPNRVTQMDDSRESIYEGRGE